ncbi:M50 family metallopeptidase [Paenibacillus mendelii]|uniref:M50 family metallopeptidase n=1 Tax=Paenibacillus mendelii TaxID=206163 RepID=A0ABV6JBU5_9BACL|nr:M50 family metallopeptidase [Paenibacillus mendelii]MCQ6562620.1 M50 family metallopeptidase [Paenibacillus mendelii]
MRAWLKMAGIVIVTAILTRFIPFSEFVRNVDTLVHELAHALVTLLLSGSVMYIHLFGNQSGVTLSSYTEAWMVIPISLAGYVGSALFALLLFLLHAYKRERAGLIVVTVLAVVGLALFVRNGYGMVWCAGFAALTALIYAAAPPWLRTGYYLLISFICLVESVISSIVILSIAVVEPGSASDAANLSQVTRVPAFIWGLLFTAFSLWCAKLSTGLLFRRGFGQQ